jgi:hypothetical protein
MKEVTGSQTSKLVRIFAPFLLVGCLALTAYFLSEGKRKRVCSSVPAAVLASNPNLERSYEIEDAKNKCITEIICNQSRLVGYSPCEFTAYDLRECRKIDPALADYKTARRHLEAEVKTCHLSKVEGSNGETVYQYRG